MLLTARDSVKTFIMLLLLQSSLPCGVYPQCRGWGCSTRFTLSWVVVDAEIKSIVQARSCRVAVRERAYLRRVGRVAVREEDVPDGADDRQNAVGQFAQRDLRIHVGGG